MEHLSNWHAFHSRDVRTYPKVDAVLQVKFENGRIEEGIASEFFPRTGLLPASSIVAWRYIKSEEDEQLTCFGFGNHVALLHRAPMVRLSSPQSSTFIALAAVLKQRPQIESILRSQFYGERTG